MPRKVPLTDLPDEPIFTARSVQQQTNLSAATLRAWEQRYGLITPVRTVGDARLYSARDVALLRWVQDQMRGGLTISRAAELLKQHRRSGETVWVTPMSPEELPDEWRI